MTEIRIIEVNDIYPVWSDFLWPVRDSIIEEHSAIIYGTYPYEYDTGVYKYKPTFFGLYLDDKLVGVNSGHMTGNRYYRSRGLYVFEEYRHRGFATALLKETIAQGRREGATHCWSMPRRSSMGPYYESGFEVTSPFFETETSRGNCYVITPITGE